MPRYPFRCFLSPNDCVSLYKTSMSCILHILGYIDAKFDAQYSIFREDMKVLSCESGLITLYLCIPETGPQNGVGGSFWQWLVPQVMFWRGYNFHMLGLDVAKFSWARSKLQVGRCQYIPIDKAFSPQVSILSHSLFLTNEYPIHKSYITNIPAMHFNLLRLKFIEFIPILYKILDINYRKNE